MRTLGALCCGLLFACTAAPQESNPHNDVVFFPTGLAMAPNETVAFVSNANSDLRYDSGTVEVLELDTVDAVVSDWVTTGKPPNDGNCSKDLDHSETLDCKSAGAFFRANAGVRLGNFATDIAVQDLGASNLRLVIPTRGDPSITWIDYVGDHLTCSSARPSNGTIDALCDDEHRLSYVHNNADLASLPDEPFGVYASSSGEFAVVTHLTTGAVTLIDSPKVGTVQIADVLSGVFLADPSTGLRGSTGVVGRSPNAGGDIVYVGSRTEDRIQTFTVGRPVNDAPPYLLPGNYFFLNAVGANSGGSNDTRGMAFSSNGEHLYLVNRRPPTVQIYDTSLGSTGFPRNKAIGATDICRQASTITVAGTGDRERAYVSCFQDGQIYVIDPRGEPRVEDIILVGRGPYSVTAAPSRNKLFVTNFLEDTIAVIDLDPTSPTFHRVVLRIGAPRSL